MRVAAYVRVSSPGQVKLETIEHQLQTVHRYVRDKGWELPEENVFRDDGYSGASLDRPALDLLRDKARIRELDAVVVLSPPRSWKDRRPKPRASGGARGVRRGPKA